MGNWNSIPLLFPDVCKGGGTKIDKCKNGHHCGSSRSDFGNRVVDHFLRLWLLLRNRSRSGIFPCLDQRDFDCAGNPVHYRKLEGKNVSSEEWPAGQSLKQVLFIIMSLLVFFVLFLLAGYIVAGIVFLSMVFWKEYKWYVAVLLSAGITLIFYVLFNHLLKVHLPIGGMLF